MIEDARRTSVEEIRAGEEHRAFYQLPVRQKLVVMLGGPTMNLFLAALLYTVALVVLGVPTLTTTVAEVAPCVPANVVDECAASDPQSPAAAAGVKAGDQIVAVDGVAYDDWLDVVDVVRAQPGEEVDSHRRTRRTEPSIFRSRSAARRFQIRTTRPRS